MTLIMALDGIKRRGKNLVLEFLDESGATAFVDREGPERIGWIRIVGTGRDNRREIGNRRIKRIDSESVLVFCKSIAEAENLADSISRAEN